jgi:hypothetical protein
MKNFIALLIAVIGMITISHSQYSQSTILNTGWESGNAAFTSYAGTSGTITQPKNLNPRTGSNSSEIKSPTSGTYNGSVISSSTVTLYAGKFYYVEVWGRCTQWQGKLKIAKSTTASNSAMLNATGSDALLDPATNNVTSTTYTKYSISWKQTTTETVYIGFYMSTTSSGTNKIGQMHIDDFSLQQRDFPYTNVTSYTSGIETISRVVIGSQIDQSSTCTDNEVTQSATHTYYNTSIMGTLYTDSIYNITVEGSTWGNFNNYYAVFIDYNRDGDFLDLFEENQLGFITNKDCSTGSISSVIQIPPSTDVDTGLVTMRIMKKFNSAPASTQSGTGYGETEDYLIRLSIGNGPIPLPVTLTQFEAVGYPRWNVVKWATASEQNSSHFVLESSYDGEMWKEIATRNAAGNSIEDVKYSWIDYNQNELTYYRLIQYDIDGKSETYGPISVMKSSIDKEIVKYVNLMGQEVNPLTTIGLVIEVYSDGSTRKLIR